MGGGSVKWKCGNVKGVNVGIGTWVPAQPLHVNGHCVTGDTLIKTVNGEKRIIDLKPGDYAYSFNEQTERIEAHEIEALFDMGLQPVFELTTQSGRRIQTTGNHPFLVGNGRDRSLQDREDIARRRLEALQARGVNIADLSESKEFAGPVVIWRTNEKNRGLMFEKGEENANGSGHLTNPEDKHPFNNLGFRFCDFGFHLRQPFFKTFFGNLQSSFPRGVFNRIEDVRQSAGAFVGKSFSENFRERDNCHNDLLDSIKHNICLIDCQSAYAENIPMPVWIKVLYLQPQDTIAVFDKGVVRWEPIVSIEYLGKKQVYDIQVQGTHNFVAGHYMNKQTGKVLTQAQEEAYAEWKNSNYNSLQKDGETIYAPGESCRNVSLPNRLKPLQQRQLTLFPWQTSLFGMFQDADQHQDNKGSAAASARHNRKILEETAGQADGENGFSQVSDKFADIFLPTLAHQDKAYHIEEGLSTPPPLFREWVKWLVILS